MRTAAGHTALADNHIKQMMNQSIFSKIWVERDGRVTAELAKPFDILKKPAIGELNRCNNEKIRGTEVLTDFFSVISNKVQITLALCLNIDFLMFVDKKDAGSKLPQYSRSKTFDAFFQV